MEKTNNRFHFDLPEGWNDQTVYFFKGPDEGNFDHMMMLAIDHQLQHDDIEDMVLEKTMAKIISLLNMIRMA